LHKIIIRPLQLLDASVSYKWRNDTEIWKYTGNKPNIVVTEELEKKWISEKLSESNSKRFAIEVDDLYVGNVQLTNISDKDAEFHIFIGNKDYWGKGIAYNAILQLLRYAKNNLNIKKVYLNVNPEHKSAIYLYKKVGFQVNEHLNNMEVQLENVIPPSVSIFCMVYNHEKFLCQCLDGFLMQKCNFDFEIVVGEDCSTDKSREILLDYAERHPGKFKLILHNKNVGAIENQRIVFQNCTGKYIAMCEGDDYWINPHKLQSQVDFLEKTPDYSFICSGTHEYLNNNGEIVLSNETENKIITKDNFCYPYLLKTATVLFDSNVIKSEDLRKFKFFKDITLFSLLLKKRNGYFVHNVTAIYRIHEGGVWSMKNKQDKVTANMNSFVEIYYLIFKSNQIKKFLIEIDSKQFFMLIFKNKYAFKFFFVKVYSTIKGFIRFKFIKNVWNYSFLFL
jgi:RimJ/RimL family protein N-acetyltransferase/glycosyltransferase involved in cell wall biosynthesis